MNNSALEDMAKEGKKACRALARADTEQKNRALSLLASSLKNNYESILKANSKDIVAAEAKQLDSAFIDRLSLKGRLDSVIADLEQIALLPDPIGERFEQQHIGELEIVKARVPIGLLGVIYESRPNVTIDVAALAIKSGNCALLRGGSEILETNRIFIDLIQKSLIRAALPQTAIQLVDSADREQVLALLKLHHWIDLIIPRGGAALHQFCRDNSSIPVITGGIGICHLFVDESADTKRAIPLIANAKTQRPSVCNALDTLLVHRAIASKFVPEIIEALEKLSVSFRLDDKAYSLMEAYKNPRCIKASDADWDREWLSLTLGIKIVDSLEDALSHIQQHSSGHSDGILTEDKRHGELFVNEIDSAAVYINASTRFTDGSQLGLGGEIAISTQKLHARGPMALKELTSYKWIIEGHYSIRR